MNTSMMFLNLGTGELLLILFAILLLFGGKKLPELARGLGRGIREFKDASSGIKNELEESINKPAPKQEEPKKEESKKEETEKHD